MNYPSNLNRPLTQAECESLSKELDKREAEVANREKTRDNLQHQVDVLVTSIAFKTKQFEQIIQDTEEAQRKARRQQVEFDKTVKLRKTMLRNLENTPAVSLDKPRLELVQLEQKLNVVRQETKEQKKYWQDQENLIALAVEEGNIQLHSIQYAVQGMDDMKKVIVQDLAELNREKIRLVDAIVDLQDRRRQQDEDYKGRTVKFNSELDQIQAKLEEAKRHHEKVVEDTERRLVLLAAKEEGLLAKQTAIRRQQTELATERRRLEGVRGLYEL